MEKKALLHHRNKRYLPWRSKLPEDMCAPLPCLCLRHAWTEKGYSYILHCDNSPTEHELAPHGMLQEQSGIRMQCSCWKCLLWIGSVEYRPVNETIDLSCLLRLATQQKAEEPFCTEKKYESGLLYIFSPIKTNVPPHICVAIDGHDKSISWLIGLYSGVVQ